MCDCSGWANGYWGYFVKTKFVSFYNSHFLRHYFSIIDTVSLHEQETLRMDGDILFGLLKKVAPSVYKHLVSTALHIVSFIIFLSFRAVKPLSTLTSERCEKQGVWTKYCIMMLLYMKFLCESCCTEECYCWVIAVIWTCSSAVLAGCDTSHWARPESVVSLICMRKCRACTCASAHTRTHTFSFTDSLIL